MATAAVLNLPQFALTATPELPPVMPRPSLRRGSPRQGEALEVLGHAIEYLMDMRLTEGGLSRADEEAIRLLMSCSRAVFHECEVVVPMRQRVSAWLAGHLRRLPV